MQSIFCAYFDQLFCDYRNLQTICTNLLIGHGFSLKIFDCTDVFSLISNLV